MSDFHGMDDLLQDFLAEATDLLSGVDNKLVDLERAPGDRALLNEIFRGFHTIKGGASFLALTPLVDLCHRGEDVFNLLRRGGSLTATPAFSGPQPVQVSETPITQPAPTSTILGTETPAPDVVLPEATVTLTPWPTNTIRP